MQIDNVNSYIIVNSYLLNVVDENGLSKDNDTLGNFPTFTKGNNTISFSSNVDKIEIEYINRYR